MSFIRPEAQAALLRWLEVLVGGGMVALGLYWALSVGGLLGWVGWALAIIGAALAMIGVRRVKFRQDGQGPGVVRVDEGKISYFGPLHGGAVAASELERLTLDPTHHPAVWILEQPGWPPLHIPVNAAGTEDLFDAFSALPGLDSGQLIRHLNRDSPMPQVIWERHAQARPDHRLH